MIRTTSSVAPRLAFVLFAGVVGTAALGVAACNEKGEDFFEPEIRTPVGALDVTPPTLSLFRPSNPSLAYNVELFGFVMLDPESGDGVPASGMDYESVTASLTGGGSLPLTRMDEYFRGSVEEVGDGAIGVRVSGMDLAGNSYSEVRNFYKLTEAEIQVQDGPPPTTESSDSSVELSFELGVEHAQHVGEILLRILEPDPGSGECTADGTPVPVGSEPGHVSQNEVDATQDARDGSISFSASAYNPVEIGGETTLESLCLHVRGRYDTYDWDGDPDPVHVEIIRQFAVSWQPPPPPPPGAIEGYVTVEGLPEPGILVILDLPAAIVDRAAWRGPGANRSGARADNHTTHTDQDGYYRFDDVTPGEHIVSIDEIPADVECEAYSQLVDVESGQDARADFDCYEVEEFGSLSGFLTVEGMGIPDVRVFVEGTDIETYTDEDGYFLLENIAAGVRQIALAAVATYLTCPMVQEAVIASGSNVLDFVCQYVAFTILGATSYWHFDSDSRVCLAIATAAALAGVAYGVQVSGPGVVGNGLHEGFLGDSGEANLIQTIVAYGTYQFLIRILNQQLETSVNVAASQGTCDVN